jgi:hypothetical protein
MNPSGIDLAAVVSNLERVEYWLTHSLGVAVKVQKSSTFAIPSLRPTTSTS